MWTIQDGRAVYVPQMQHTRAALGLSRVPDVVTLIERKEARG